MLPMLLLGFAVLAVFVMFLLSEINPATFGFWNLSWSIVLLAGLAGLILTLDGLFEKNVGVIKKSKITIGIGLLVLATILLIPLVIPQEDGWFKKYGYAIIGIGVGVVLILSVIAVGGKKWDQADNKNVGYKNYYQRKEEQEKAEKKENK